MVKVKLSLYQSINVYGVVAVCSARVHIFRYICRYENRLLTPLGLSVRPQQAIRFPLHGSS